MVDGIEEKIENLIQIIDRIRLAFKNSQCHFFPLFETISGEGLLTTVEQNVINAQASDVFKTLTLFNVLKAKPEDKILIILQKHFYRHQNKVIFEYVQDLLKIYKKEDLIWNIHTVEENKENSKNMVQDSQKLISQILQLQMQIEKLSKENCQLTLLLKKTIKSHQLTVSEKMIYKRKYSSSKTNQLGIKCQEEISYCELKNEYEENTINEEQNDQHENEYA